MKTQKNIRHKQNTTERHVFRTQPPRYT